MRRLEHKVTIVSGVYSIEGWQTYDITNDMLSPADAFSLAVGPTTPELWRALAKDSEVQVFLDDTRILTGFIDRRAGSSSKRTGSSISISGRDRGGRLVDERMPLISFGGLGIADLAKRCADPWIPNVALSNATNRRLISGGGAVGRVSGEPLVDVNLSNGQSVTVPRSVAGAKSTGNKAQDEAILLLSQDAKRAEARRKVRPGESRWQVLAHFLEEAKLLAWSSADGKTLIVGQPNYQQEPTFTFFHPGPGSIRADESNVESLEVVDDCGEMYSKIICLSETHDDFDDAVTRVSGEAVDGPGPDGTGKHLQHPKVLIVTDNDVKTRKQAIARAERELAERAAAGHELVITVRGHGQRRAGAARPTLYAFDLMARVESEEFEIKGDYLITRVRFSCSKEQGPTTELRLVPKGTVLTV